MPIPRATETDCGLLVVDLQERFSPIIRNWDDIVAASSRLIRFFRLITAPIVVTEQYPKGLGPTIQSIRDLLETSTDIAAKTTFSSCGSEDVQKLIQTHGRKQWILCGIETHVCVQQTALDLLDSGRQVFLAADALSSRAEVNREFALRRMEQAGAVVSTSESLIFEILKDSKHPLFKQASAIVK